MEVPMSGFTQLRFLIGASLAIVIGASTDADAQTTALRGARVVDGRGGAPIDNATIGIRGGRIVAIGSSSATPIPNGAEVVNYTGKTIIPGLISGHSHVGIFVGLKAARGRVSNPPYTNLNVAMDEDDHALEHVAGLGEIRRVPHVSPGVDICQGDLATGLPVIRDEALGLVPREAGIRVLVVV